VERSGVAAPCSLARAAYGRDMVQWSTLAIAFCAPEAIERHRASCVGVFIDARRIQLARAVAPIDPRAYWIRGPCRRRRNDQ
jgi:hypothetical protein